MIVAPVTHNWEADYGPLGGLGGLLSGSGKGFLTQVANALNAANGGDGKSGLIGLFMQGRHNRDDAKIRYDTDVAAGLKNANAILNGIGQYRNDDGTYDVDKLKADPRVMGLLADHGITNIDNNKLADIVTNTNSWKDRFGEHANMGYAQNHAWKEYQGNPYQGYDPSTFYGNRDQSTLFTPTIGDTPGLFPTVGDWPASGSWTMTNPFTGQPITNETATPDAGQLMQSATQVNPIEVPTRDSTLSKTSQEAGQQATQEAVKKGMEAANKGPGLLGSMIKGAIIGAATGGSGWAGALSGAKNYGLSQLGGLGQLYGAYQGIHDATSGNNAAGAQGAQTTMQNPMSNWQNFSLAQPMGYRVGDYTRSFAHNIGYGGLL